jgi:DnaJ-domain-containing protein 1
MPERFKPWDYYETLEVHRDACPQVIEAAYKQLARRYHPDRGSATDTTETMKAINEAYAIVSDPDKRSQLDEAIDRGEVEERAIISVLHFDAEAGAAVGYLGDAFMVLRENPFGRFTHSIYLYSKDFKKRTLMGRGKLERRSWGWYVVGEVKSGILWFSPLGPTTIKVESICTAAEIPRVPDFVWSQLRTWASGTPQSTVTGTLWENELRRLHFFPDGTISMLVMLGKETYEGTWTATADHVTGTVTRTSDPGSPSGQPQYEFQGTASNGTLMIFKERVRYVNGERSTDWVDARYVPYVLVLAEQAK